jgi:hypothetical protein
MAELTSIPFQDGRYRFCLDQVENGTFPYRFAWRGTSVSPDGFINRPAEFDWGMLGRIIRQAVDQRLITNEELVGFMRGLVGSEAATSAAAATDH